MRFVFPILTLTRGGAQRMLVEITNALVEKGHHVTILMPAGAQVAFAVKAFVKHTGTPYQLFESDYPYADVIVSTYHTIVESAHQASQNGKGQHVRFSLCYEPPILPEGPAAFHSYHFTKHVLVLSEWQRQIIYMNHGIQSHIVPIGLDPVFQNLHARDQIGSPFQISAVLRRPEGGFSPHREQDYLISELSFIKQAFPSIRINVICPPEELYTSPSLQSLATQGLFRVLTPGNDIELCYHYSESNIFVSSTVYDAGSLPGLEAMRCGAALVTLYAGGNMDYCDNEQNSLVSYRHEGKLRHDIIRLIQDKQLREELAQKGEKDSLVWTWGRSAAAFEAAITQILSGV